MAVEDAYELAYREAVRALDHQFALLTELRSRAGMLLAAASIAVSLLGRDPFRGMPPCAWAAIVCFALLSICVLAIVWPRDAWGVDVDPRMLLDTRLSTREPAFADLSLELISHLTRHRATNGRRLAQTARLFRVGACLLAIQLVLTVLAASGMV